MDECVVWVYGWVWVWSCACVGVWVLVSGRLITNESTEAQTRGAICIELHV